MIFLFKGSWPIFYRRCIYVGKFLFDLINSTKYAIIGLLPVNNIVKSMSDLFIFVQPPNSQTTNTYSAAFNNSQKLTGEKKTPNRSCIFSLLLLCALFAFEFVVVGRFFSSVLRRFSLFSPGWISVVMEIGPPIQSLILTPRFLVLSSSKTTIIPNMLNFTIFKNHSLHF